MRRGSEGDKRVYLTLEAVSMIWRGKIVITNTIGFYLMWQVRIKVKNHPEQPRG